MSMSVLPDPHNVLSRSGDVLSAELDGETVLLRVDSGAYFGLDDILTEVWLRLETPQTVATLYGALSEFYTTDIETIGRDLAPLLADMAAEGLIDVTGSALG